MYERNRWIGYTSPFSPDQFTFPGSSQVLKWGVLAIHKTMGLVFNKKLTVQDLMYYSLPFYRSLVCGHRNRRKFYLVTCPSFLMILTILENCTNTEKKINKQTQSDCYFFLWALMKSTILESMCTLSHFRLAMWYCIVLQSTPTRLMKL